MFQELYRLMKKDDLLHQSYHESNEMLKTTEQMFTAAFEALRKNDSSDISMDIYDRDKSVNEGERDIRRKVLTHLTIVGNQSDINAAFVLITIIHDMERIGDYTKNIYELAKKHPQRLDFLENEAKVTLVEEIILETFRMFTKSFEHTSKDVSRKAMKDLHNAKKEIDQMIDKYIDAAYESNHGKQSLIICVLYIRFLKRIAAHLNNIATSFVNPFDRIGFEE